MSKYIAAILVVPAAIAFADSFGSTPTADDPPAQREAHSAQALRTKTDLARGMRWELEWGGVVVRDLATGKTLRHIPLPGATFAGARDSSLPDLLLGRTGAAFVSSNVQPRIWRISPARFEVELFDIALDSDEGKDFGFDNLAWETDEKVLRATNAPGGIAWRIELHSATASRAAAAGAAKGIALQR
jgi:hypothetical protein